MKTATRLVNYCFIAVFSAAAVSSCTNANESERDEATQDTLTGFTQVWKTDSSFTGSESTLYNPGDNTIYVSCGNTDPGAKDSDGFIALLNPDGSVKDMEWVTGLHAPKGMAILNDKLYVTDIDEVKVIDIKSASVEKIVPVEGAVFLNDVASDGKLVYFSDSRTGKVYSLSEAGEIKTIITDVEGVNGLECYNGALYVLDGEGLKKYNTEDFSSSLINSKVLGGDGLVILNDSTFIASRWAGEIYYIKGAETTLLLDTKEDKSNTADIGFIKDQNLLLVPTFMKNEVAAYKLTYSQGD